MQVKEGLYHCLNDDTRICWASHETFATGFEGKYGMRQIGRKEGNTSWQTQAPRPCRAIQREAV